MRTTTHAVLTTTTHAVFFHPEFLISYKRLRYIQPPLLSRRSLLHVSWVPTLSLTRGNVGSLPRSITVTVVSDLPGRGGTGDDCLVLVLQYCVHKSDFHAVIAFSRTCNLALDDCRRVTGRLLGGTCRARGCALPMFSV